MAVVLARLVVARHPLGDAFHLVEEVAERPLDDKIDRPGGSDQRNLGERGEMGGGRGRALRSVVVSGHLQRRAD